MFRLNIIPLEERIVLDATLFGALGSLHTSDPTVSSNSAQPPDDVTNAAKSMNGKVKDSPIIYVDITNTSKSMNGKNWNKAYNNLQDALAAAAQSKGPDQIWIADGTYTPGNLSSSTYILPDNVALYGGFAGGEKSLSQRDGAHVTTLDGLGVINTLLTVDTKTVLVDSLTLTRSFNSALAAYQSNVDISHVVFSNNLAERGGGLFSIASNITIKDSKFMQNEARYRNGDINNSAQGGALYAESSIIKITNSQFTGNRSPDGFGGQTGQGGGIYAEDSQIKVVGSLFQSNSASDLGAISVGLGTGTMSNSLDIRDSQFIGNTASRAVGGVYFERGTFSIKDTTFTSNTSDIFAGTGGALAIVRATGTINHSTFNDNTSGAGGAIVITTENNVTIKNSTFTNNSGTLGAAIYSQTADTVTIKSSTFTGNHTDLAGGAIFSLDDTSLHISNSTFTDNSGDFEGGALSVTNNQNLIVEHSTFTDNSSTNFFGFGGAINIGSAFLLGVDDNTHAVIDSNTFTGNVANIAGGAINVQSSSGNFTITNNDFSLNSDKTISLELLSIPPGTVNGSSVHSAIPALLVNANTGLITDDIQIN